MKRFALLIGVNIAIIAVISVTLRVLGVENILQENNVDLNYDSLLVFSAVIGFISAFMSLALSKMMAKSLMGLKPITTPSNNTEKWLIDVVTNYAQKAGIKTPEFCVYNDPAPNAFATGMSKNASLVAVSTGLINHMSQKEVEAVVGHEIAHIANGDMVTMALLQGVINTFVIFFSRIAGHFFDRVILKNEEGYGIGYIVATIVFQILFGILASTITMWFSRIREYKADEGGSYLAGKENMISALQKLQSLTPGHLPEQLAAFGIGNAKMSKVQALFASHPPLEKRIAHLQGLNQSQLAIS